MGIDGNTIGTISGARSKLVMLADVLASFSAREDWIDPSPETFAELSMIANEAASDLKHVGGYLDAIG